MTPAKLLMVGGAVMFLMGAILHFGARAGLGNLPGDVAWRRGNVSVFAPFATMLIVSVVLTIVLNVVMRFFR
jgi:hypothetical protein